jgi:hypothetical protein
MAEEAAYISLKQAARLGGYRNRDALDRAARLGVETQSSRWVAWW